MKALTLVLTASLAANVALAAIVALRTSTEPAPLSARASAVAATDRGTAANAPTPEAAQAAAEAAARQAWQQFHGGDLRLMVARLRAAGFPLTTIRAIVRVEINARLEDKRRAAYGNLANVPHWKQDAMSRLAESKVRSELDAEYLRQLKEALGPDWRDASPGSLAAWRSMYGDLPLELVDQVEKLRNDYDDIRREISATARDVILPEDRAKLALLDKELRADLAKLLTPEQMTEYEIRSDPTSASLRSRLETFKPTEEEFRIIYQLQKAIDLELGGASAITSEDVTARQLRERQLVTDLFTLLPQERVIQYQLATNPSLSQINRLLLRFELPTQVAVDVIGVQQDAQQRVRSLRENSRLAPEQRTAQLAALQREVQSKVSAALGPRAFQAYQEYGGQWMQNIVPRPPLPAAQN